MYTGPLSVLFPNTSEWYSLGARKPHHGSRHVDDGLCLFWVGPITAASSIFTAEKPCKGSGLGKGVVRVDKGPVLSAHQLSFRHVTSSETAFPQPLLRLGVALFLTPTFRVHDPLSPSVELGCGSGLPLRAQGWSEQRGAPCV